jgi:hypothetical protein
MPDLDDGAMLPDGACAKLVCGAAIWAAGAGRRCAKMIVKAEDEDGDGLHIRYMASRCLSVNLMCQEIYNVLFMAT